MRYNYKSNPPPLKERRDLRPEEKVITPGTWRREMCRCGHPSCRKYFVLNSESDHEGRYTAADSAAMVAIPLMMRALELAEALEMPYEQGYAVFRKHGYERGFGLGSASAWARGQIKVALDEARKVE